MSLRDRFHGVAPYEIAVLHGGPGGAGEVTPLARAIAALGYGVLEPMQRGYSVAEQVTELKEALLRHGDGATAIVGWSWGAWLGCALAARHPTLVRKLILVSSGPFSEAEAAGIMKTRMARLPEADQAVLRGLMQGGFNPSNVGQVVALMAKADNYDPDESQPPEIHFDAGIFQSVWAEASEMRRSGALMRLVRQIRCPISVLHGDYDPGPAEGVRRPLEAAGIDFSFRLLAQCGHKPWIERAAREPFLKALAEELATH